MDIYVVDEEINGPVNGYAQPDEEKPSMRRERAEQETGDTRRGEDEEKQVVFLEPAPLFEVGPMVVFVPPPAKAMHDELMGEPRHEFHAAHCGEGDEDIFENHFMRI